MPQTTPDFLYFAYGSNMSSRRLTARGRAPSATRLTVGYVPGRRLTFDKFSTRDQSGKCDCEATGEMILRIDGKCTCGTLADRRVRSVVHTHADI